MGLVRLALGALLLLFGKRLFWLFVGVAGFITGANLATQFFPSQGQTFILIAAVVLGIVGALLATFLQNIALVIAGFLAGGYLLNYLMALFNFNTGGLGYLAFVIGGVLGALLVVIMFNWALIILSSLFGAVLIVETLPVDSIIATLIIAALAILGMFLQSREMD